MNIQYRHVLTSTMAVLLTVVSSSCMDNFLDRKPLDQVSPMDYNKTAEQLASFSIDKYADLFGGHSGWGAGMANWDNGTDNQAGNDANRMLFSKDDWKVPTRGGYGMARIRDVNAFLKDALEKKENGLISGEESEIEHYIGEAYFIRAFLYFLGVSRYGDYPIVKEPLPDEEAVLVENSKRQPRNEVVRFILQDLDTAIDLLKETTPGNQRISKRVALLFKSRVALFEATFEKYHRGSGRVPGDANWPGKDREWNAGKTFDQEGEVKFFLRQAMEAAKTVADAIPLTANNHAINPEPGVKTGWNPYFDMYSSVSLASYPEIVLWRQYDKKVEVMHSAPLYLYGGAANGWTRSLVESFLMKNGLPIYAAGSGYQGDENTSKVVKNRDERLQLFMWHEGCAHDNTGFFSSGKYTKMTDEQLNLFTSELQSKDVTGYRQRKYFTYDNQEHYPHTHISATTASPIYRVAEAYLNYIEASYLLNNTIDATAAKYWKALRERAGIDTDFNKTIAATDMSYEADVTRASYDWGAFSAGKPIDATLYSIRRERRCEYAGEGIRLADLKRWRAMDQVKSYQIEGMNFWSSLAKSPLFTWTLEHDFPGKKIEDLKPEEREKLGSSKIVATGDAGSNMSSSSLAIYIRPYQVIKKNNPMYDGYTFYQAHYLNPFSFQEIQLATPQGKDLEDSHLYQNPGWPSVANGEAEY